MASEALDKAGLHFDDLNRIRVLDEDSSSQAQELKEVCQDFLGDIGDFQVKHQESGVRRDQSEIARPGAWDLTSAAVGTRGMRSLVTLLYVC